MKTGTLLTLAGLAAVLLTGCSQPQQVVSADPVCLPQISVVQAMEAARTVLDRMQFSIEKYDPEVHYIRTRPLSGAQVFEFWRQDNASAAAVAQANLQSIRRIVEIEAVPSPERTCIECRVYVQQLSMPETPLKSTRWMAGTFTDSSTSYQTLQLDSAQIKRMEWLDKGVDRDLEQKILSKLREQAAL